MQRGVKTGFRSMLLAVVGMAILSSADFAEGFSTIYRYDELNRLYKVEYEDGTFIEYAYDNVGNRMSKQVGGTVPPVSSVSLSASPPSPQVPGTAVTFTGSAAGGSGSYQYEFRQRQVGQPEFTLVQAYGASPTWPWTAVAGNWEMKVNARNAGSTAEFEATQTIADNVTAPGGANYFDNFNTDTSANYVAWVGGFTIAGGKIGNNGSAMAQTYNNAYSTNTINQYARIQNVGASGSDTGVLFRTTGSGGYYTVRLFSDNKVYWVRFNNGVFQQVVQITAFGSGMAANDNLAVTIAGTGNDTVVRVWKNPANNTPYSCSAWDNPSHSPTVTLTNNPSVAIDTGFKAGLARNSSGNAFFDNFYWGDCNP